MSNKPAEQYTVQDIKNFIRVIDGRRVNPTWMGKCIYTDRRNPARHCIIGEFLSREGFRVPIEHSFTQAHRLLNDLGFRPEVSSFAQEIQTFADEPRVWEDVKKEFLDDYATATA